MEIPPIETTKFDLVVDGLFFLNNSSWFLMLNSVQQVEALRQSILKKAFEGKLVALWGPVATCPYVTILIAFLAFAGVAVSTQNILH